MKRAFRGSFESLGGFAEMWSPGIVVLLGCWSWHRAESVVHQVTEVRAVAGSDALLPCVGNFSVSNVAWQHVGKSSRPDRVLSNGSLLVEKVDALDAGNYSCRPDLEGTALISIVHLIVLSPPSTVDGVEARADLNYATISWKLPDPEENVEGFRVSYAVAASEPRWIEPSYLFGISAESEIVDIYHLTPGTSYMVKIEAFNVAGSSKPVTVSFRTLLENEKCVGQTPLSETRRNKKDLNSVGLFASGILFALACVLVVGSGLYWCRRHKLMTCQSSGVLDDKDMVCETIELIPNVVVNPRFEQEAAQDDND
ncbi:unnamed protein product [Notodromas monacha]|uniref:Uncharacterized protein n=1 Tax=Notodromas monacha TaxID=399045 RepID=A0A7R9BI26_9CRUS|nr:unnamed protein product [Notodromas monacha]CAG0915889.1 unnamed protein product [Notodromas monacha]